MLGTESWKSFHANSVDIITEKALRAMEIRTWEKGMLHFLMGAWDALPWGIALIQIREDLGREVYWNLTGSQLAQVRNRQEPVFQPGVDVFWSPGYERKLGVEEWPMYRSLAEGNIVENFDMVWQKITGECIPLRWNSYPIFQENGIVGAVLVFSPLGEIEHVGRSK